MLFFLPLLAVVLWAVSGFCIGKKTVQGDITMKVAPNIAQINLGTQHVTAGQRLNIYRQECRFAVCNKELVGGGRVSRVFDKKYSEITLDPGVYFDVGYVIERE
ncbi:hypothetical protein [Bdellovibrio sp. HCB2-146]|uniref:hypothetical protein n=1 Tax=Bdellovibrio sp. HCB2-146 TaxID=3394362 RepID=UPI0039BD3677